MTSILRWLLVATGIVPPGPKRTKIVRDVFGAADWMAKALTSSGYDADYSLESLREMDRFFDEHSADGHPRPGGLLAERTRQRIFGLGAYVGEVIRRRGGGGEWIGDDGDPKAEINVRLKLASGTEIWPMQRAIKRLVNGEEDAVYPYAAIVLNPTS